MQVDRVQARRDETQMTVWVDSKEILAGFGTTYHDTAPQAFVLNPSADKDSLV